jgi:hypothetical protein
MSELALRILRDWSRFGIDPSGPFCPQSARGSDHDADDDHEQREADPWFFTGRRRAFQRIANGHRREDPDPNGYHRYHHYRE